MTELRRSGKSVTKLTIEVCHSQPPIDYIRINTNLASTKPVRSCLTKQIPQSWPSTCADYGQQRGLSAWCTLWHFYVNAPS